MRRSESGRILAKALLLIVLLGVVGFLALAAFRAGPAPEIQATPAGGSIGRKTAVTVTVTEPVRGLSSVKAELVQGERVETLAQKTYVPAASWRFWGTGTDRDTLTLEIGRDTIKGLKAGALTLRVTADSAPAWLSRTAPAVKEITFQVRLTPPSLGVTSTFHFVRQGGAEAVVYRVGESSVRDGVQAGDRWFPGFPLPGGGKEDRFALFAVPYDMSDSSNVKLTAADDAGNESKVSFIDQFTPSRPIEATINLSDAFLNKVVPAIMSQTPDLADAGGLVENFLSINRDLRKANAAELVELASKSKPQFLWSRTFLPMSNAKVMAPFAEQRSYAYQSRIVDHQVHLGFDLASTRAVPVAASNDGVVALARFFGIYGNAVVVDHGYGLQTLYAHLSSIDVKEGQEVKRGDTLGRTGDTGLAGGDHLHFSILLAGQPVDPREWWDGHWIKDRVARKLGGALRFED
ncbi:MAG TPA: M23 family metallopeptidase [Candidatus Polarisedimenticolia bacterium]|nr:M23 family metallopeptidase [Candidatus Polarisedimenticolia bacterium]